jgi:hypothetical protein
MKRRVLEAVAAPAPQTGEILTLEGILVLKGNEPATVPALMVKDSELWELQNVSLATAKRLQNKRIEVTGWSRGAGLATCAGRMTRSTAALLNRPLRLARTRIPHA